MHQFLEEDSTYRVIATCRHPENALDLQHLKETYHDQLIIMQLDIGVKESHEQLKERLLQDHNIHSIDIIVANAAIAVNHELLQTTEQDMMNCFHTNVIGNLFLFQSLLDLVLVSELKIIVVISSNLG